MKAILITLSINLALLLAGAFWVESQTPSLAYIDITEVFGKFQLTEEMNSKADNSQRIRKNVLDSLKIKAELRVGKLRSQTVKGAELAQVNLELRAIEDEYYRKHEEFAEANKNEEKRYNQQIIEQINQYVEEYRKITGFDCILGNTGSGNVMAASETLDITDDVIAYINKRYEGR
ncbi:MAG: OmpH family outer membrane protein [Flavobacteriales bacterium]|nr:OmpH family outer membrane protein [Flavobacteriales bacterium]